MKVHVWRSYSALGTSADSQSWVATTVTTWQWRRACPQTLWKGSVAAINAQKIRVQSCQGDSFICEDEQTSLPNTHTSMNEATSHPQQSAQRSASQDLEEFTFGAGQSAAGTGDDDDAGTPLVKSRSNTSSGGTAQPVSDLQPMLYSRLYCGTQIHILKRLCDVERRLQKKDWDFFSLEQVWKPKYYYYHYKPIFTR